MTRVRPALRCSLLAAAIACVALAGGAATAHASSGRAHYYSLATKGIAAAHRHWWDGGRHWYDAEIHSHGSTPLATIWDVVPLWEAIDAQAIGHPSAAHKAAATAFAGGAERYWNPHVSPHGAWAPYPGDRNGGERTFFDDNGWWGLAFVDAYRATRNKRYLDDAARASRFDDERGWDGKHGMWWNTEHPRHSLEAWSSAAALAAELYEFTGKSTYRKRAHKYIAWGDRYAQAANHGLYATKEQPVLSYVEGAMIGAQLALCKGDHKKRCPRAEALAEATYEKWNGGSPDHAPQFDTILMRYVVQLGAYDHDPTWWEWAHRVARHAESNASHGGLWLRFWDGSNPTAHTAGDNIYYSDMIQTHSATVALFAWLAAYERPPGKARPVPPGVGERPSWRTWITVDRQKDATGPLCYIQGHIAGFSNKAVHWHLRITLSGPVATDLRDKDGDGRAGEKTTGVVTILERHLRDDAGPLEVDVVGTAAGKTYRSHKSLSAPWC